MKRYAKKGKTMAEQRCMSPAECLRRKKRPPRQETYSSQKPGKSGKGGEKGEGAGKWKAKNRGWRRGGKNSFFGKGLLLKGRGSILAIDKKRETVPSTQREQK